MDRPALARPVLHRAADVARILGCSEWWVKEQARNRRIPYSWIGGSYRFTDQHITEIVRLFEVRPVEARVPAQRSTMQAGDTEGSPVSYLKARTPRRARIVAQDQAA
jgi:hypothetical protein